MTMMKYDEEKASVRNVDAAFADEESSYIGSVVGSVDGAASATSATPIINRTSVAVAMGVPATDPSSPTSTTSRARNVIKTTRKKSVLALVSVALLVVVVLVVAIVATSGGSKRNEDAASAAVVGINSQPPEVEVEIAAETTIPAVGFDANLNEDTVESSEVLSEELERPEVLPEESVFSSSVLLQTDISTAPSQMPVTSGPTSAPTSVTLLTMTPPADALGDAGAANDADAVEGEGESSLEDPVEEQTSGGSWVDEFVDAVVELFVAVESFLFGGN